MKASNKLWIIICVCLSFVGCTGTVNRSNVIDSQDVVPTPEIGKATLIGSVQKEGKPYKNATIRLAELFYGADGEAAFALNESFSPSTVSDEAGNFIFSNIKPGEYVIIVGSLTENYQIDADVNEKAIVRKVDSGAILSVEPIKVNLP